MIDKEIEILEQIVQERRKELINKILNLRTRHLTVVLEDIYQSQNASAVLRSCECFGIQDVHIIENFNTYEINPDVTRGSNKWLTLYKYNDENDPSLQAINELKKKGYRLIATTPNQNNDEPISVYKPNLKTALFFGNEHAGLSKKIINEMDDNISIPMTGFTESLNISVSAGILISQLTQILRSSSVDWHLNELEKKDLKLIWLKNSVRKPEVILRELIQKSK